MVVHFPLALVITAAFMLLAARVLRPGRWSASLATVGTWNLWLLGAAAALFALATGLAATLRTSAGRGPGAAHQAISLHFRWAAFTTLALLLAAVVRRGVPAVLRIRDPRGFFSRCCGRQPRR